MFCTFVEIAEQQFFADLVLFVFSDNCVCLGTKQNFAAANFYNFLVHQSTLYELVLLQFFLKFISASIVDYVLTFANCR